MNFDLAQRPLRMIVNSACQGIAQIDNMTPDEAVLLLRQMQLTFAKGNTKAALLSAVSTGLGVLADEIDGWVLTGIDDTDQPA